MTVPQGPSAAATPDQAVIEVRTSFFFLAFILHFCKVYVALNGHAAQQRWGTVSIPVAPGRYTVEAWTNYFIAPEMGRNGVVIDAMPGTVTRIRWKAPWLIFLKGSIAVTDVAPLDAGAAVLPPSNLPAPPAPPAPAQAASPEPTGPTGMDQPAVDEVPVAGTHAQPPVPGMTAPGFGLTPTAPWAPTAPFAGGRPAPVAPAGWHPDPTGRHQHRWFDGSAWTNHVSDGGVASTDEGIQG
jgi:hypothetical protein